MPTLARLAGATVPNGLDGVDVSELLTGHKSSLIGRDLYSFTSQAGLEREQIAIRSADGWKLVVIGPDIREPGGFRTARHRVELFRIREDPYERFDVATDHPDVVRNLGEKLIAFRKTEPPGAMPTLNKPQADFMPPKQWRNSPELPHAVK